MGQRTNVYITEKEAKILTGYKRTSLYNLRIKGLVRWSQSHSGRKIEYHKGDLLKLARLGNQNVVNKDQTRKKKAKKLPEKEDVSILEACEIFGIDRWTLRRAMNKFKIKGVVNGRQTMVKVKQLEKIFTPIQYLGEKVIKPEKKNR